MDTNVIDSGSTTLPECLIKQATHIVITPDQDIKSSLLIGVTRTGKSRLSDTFVSRNLTTSREDI
jgi:hypothetical protein